MASPESKRIRLFQDEENIANVNELQNNVSLKIPIDICYKKFDEMRKNNQLCDIKIVAKNGEEIWAHKVILAANSEYFNIMFNSQFKESKELEIKIQELDPYVLNLLIDFIYSSELVINEQNVQGVVIGISLLQLDETIRDKCIDYIKSRIDPANCLGMKEMAECLGLRDFYSFCLSYTLINFSQVYKNEEFLLITFDQLLQVIKNEDICVNEEKVYESVMKWIKYDKENRIKHLADLMKYVRLPIISLKFFECVVVREPLLKLNKDCKAYLDEVDAINDGHETNLEVLNSIRTQYRPNYSEYVFITGKSGRYHLPLLYNIITDEWKTIPTIIPVNIYGITYLLNDGRLFNFGGINSSNELENFDPFEHNYDSYIYNMPLLNSCHIFDPDTKNWNKREGMLKNRRKCCVVQIGSHVYLVDTYNSEYYNIECDKWFSTNSINIYRTDYAVISLNGFIYAVGGNINNYEVNIVERFDPKSNTWKIVTPMLHGRVDPTLCVLNNCIYAIGGKRNSSEYLSLVEKYDPSTDSWEEVTELNHSRSNAGAVTVNGLIYVFGGNHSNFTIEVYCPFKKTWSVLSSKVPSTIDFHGTCYAFNVKQNIQSVVLKLTG